MVGDPHGDRANGNGGFVRVYYKAHEEIAHASPSYMYAVCLLCLFKPSGLESFCERSEKSFKCKPTFTGWYDPRLSPDSSGVREVIDEWSVKSFEAVYYWHLRKQMSHYGVRLIGAAPDGKRPLNVVFLLTEDGLRIDPYTHIWQHKAEWNPSTESGAEPSEAPEQSVFSASNTGPRFQRPDGRHYTVRDLVGGHRGTNGLIAAGRYVQRFSASDPSTEVNDCESYAKRFVCAFAHELKAFQEQCAKYPNEVEEVRGERMK